MYRLATFACTALAALTLSVSAATTQGSEILLAVWDTNNQLVLDADVTGELFGGGEMKAISQGNGFYQLLNIGTPSPSGLKVSMVVNGVAAEGMFNDVSLITANVTLGGPSFAVMGSTEMIEITPVGGPGGDGSNDDCDGAISIAIGSLTAGSTIGSTADGSAFCGTAPGIGGGVWYTVVGDGTTLTASTATAGECAGGGGSADYDTKINVYCQDCATQTCVTGNDDCNGSAGNFHSQASWASEAGGTYLILVSGFGTSVGNFELGLSSDGTPATGAIACTPPQATGACCFTDGSCEVLTEDECGAAGGEYQGDDSPCEVGGTREYSSSEAASIPDGLGTGVPGAAASTTINVGDSGTIADVNVSVDIAHTWTGDLIVSLTHGATTVTLIDRPGVPATTFGCAEDNYSGTVLDDEAAGSIEGVCSAGFPGSYIPASALSAFDGQDKAGDWTLSVTDNAAADTGSILGWGLTIDNGGGEPVCTPVECFLVVGDTPGASGFLGIDHLFNTQVGPAVEDSFAVLMEDIPSFVLPPLQRRGRTVGQGHGTIGWQQVPEAGSPSWMADGEFAVQVLMWNPTVFPSMPEQYTSGLHVEIAPNGVVSTTPFGDDVGGLSIWAEITTDSNGVRHIAFPFLVPGL